MIRLATIEDLDAIEETYNEHFQHEIENGAYTIFKKDVYPTRKDAEKALAARALYVWEENGAISGSIIVDAMQPPEYASISWQACLHPEKVLVIHLLLIRPSMAGRGIATALVNHALDMARKSSCRAVRLDTGSQNSPAVSLYQKMGFKIVGRSSMKVGNAIPHAGHLFLEKILQE